MTKKTGRTDAPKTLSREAAQWWKRLIAEYGIEDEVGFLLLQTALESFDRMRSAQAAIAEDGASVMDRFGQTKSHPLLVVERDSRSGMLQALKGLHFDIEPLRDLGRSSRGKQPEMPTTRKRVTRKRVEELSPALIELLLHGTSESDPFLEFDVREEARRALWGAHEEVLLAAWRALGRTGDPPGLTRLSGQS